MVRYILNNLKLNILKLKYFHIFKLTNDITIDNIKIDIVDKYKCVGLYLDTQLSFNILIDNLNLLIDNLNQTFKNNILN